MRFSKFKKLLFYVSFVTLIGCSHSPTRSFYYWKTSFSLSDHEVKTISELNITQLYIRFFDVDWDAASNQPVPLGKIRFRDSVPIGLQVVPTVYIVNRTLQKTTDEEVTALSERILNLVFSITRSNHIAFSEIQLDCDWTETTRNKYFSLLQCIRSSLKKQNKTLSATIRLHQIKYANITGIPPVDRGMLMYYNMGKIDATLGRNSIYNSADASKYTDYIEDYPLALDLALPAFSWGIHIRNNRVIELLNNMNLNDFKNNDNFTATDSAIFRVNYPFFYRGFYFQKDDLVKVEEISPQLCKFAAQQVSKKMKQPETVAIYHLDSTSLSHYEKHDFQEIFNFFR